jgi:hypothetical protein
MSRWAEMKEALSTPIDVKCRITLQASGRQIPTNVAMMECEPLPLREEFYLPVGLGETLRISVSISFCGTVNICVGADVPSPTMNQCRQRWCCGPASDVLAWLGFGLYWAGFGFPALTHQKLLTFGRTKS